MLELPRLPDLVAYLLPLVGLAAVFYAYRITAAGKEREKEILRLSD
jgi:hypothetical protein